MTLLYKTLSKERLKKVQPVSNNLIFLLFKVVLKNKSYLIWWYFKIFSIIIQKVIARQNLALPTFDHMLFCHKLLHIMFGKIFSDFQRPAKNTIS